MCIPSNSVSASTCALSAAGLACGGLVANDESSPLGMKEEKVVAKAIARTRRVVRRDWTRAEVKELRQHSKNKTRVKTISKALKRTPGALRQKARALGIPLGHRRAKK
jgi:hypothetical protein